MYKLSFEALLDDLYKAYLDARRGKRNKPYQIKFEKNLCANLYELCTELWSRSYKPLPSTCFIITDPKKREVFAAEFRDRIVHHLYFNYTHTMFERTFIADSYSCIENRGTHYGMRRLRDHIRSESRAFTRPCYIMKLDIRGYFMHIDRQKLCDVACSSLRRMANHRVNNSLSAKWKDVVDIDFVLYLTKDIALLNPLADCKVIGKPSEWNDLPKDKSLFCSPDGLGLPIGNLTSQLFSNVYLGVFDDYMKRNLKCHHYGRYVDDAYVVSADRKWLLELVPKITAFLKERLSLELHTGKLKIVSAYNGVEFLGAFIKPHTMYISNASLVRLRKGVRQMWQDALRTGDMEHFTAQSASFRGVLSHYDSWHLKEKMYL